MTSWCFLNNFIAPPQNLPAPKPLTNCTKPLSEWCSSKEIADACAVRNFFLNIFGKIIVFYIDYIIQMTWWCEIADWSAPSWKIVWKWPGK